MKKIQKVIIIINFVYYKKKCKKVQMHSRDSGNSGNIINSLGEGTTPQKASIIGGVTP